MSADLNHLAAVIDEAARTGTAIPQLSEGAAFTVDQAYLIQRLSIQRRLDRGETMVGLKMGFTSREKMRQMGVHEMIWGLLTSSMQLEDGGEVQLAGRVHPRIEPEIAFLLKAPLAGEISPVQALAAVEAVAPAMEVIDSRFRNFKFSLADVVADNCSSSGFVVGPWNRPDTDLSNRAMVMEMDGVPVQIGSSAAILGNPVRSLVAAARVAGAAGMQLEPGWILMAGGATAAVHLSPGQHVRLQVEGMGQVNLGVR